MPADDVAIQVLHAEALHASDRQSRSLQTQEALITIVVALTAVVVGVSGYAERRQLLAALPLVLGLLFTFLLHRYADADARLAYHDYLTTLINLRLPTVKRQLVAEQLDQGLWADDERVDQLLLAGRALQTRRPRHNASQYATAWLFALSVVALFVNGLRLVHTAALPLWSTIAYDVAAIAVQITMGLAARELLGAPRILFLPPRESAWAVARRALGRR